ncbi:MAG: SDR family NAD(P)-dependent oxidoreductase [Actinomycetota bacterium]
MNGPVFVTGGSGLVGKAVVNHLVAAGQEVRALARSEAARTSLEELGAKTVPGDILDEASVRAAMTGCGVAYHIAGLNAFCLRDPAPLFRVNVEGSLNVVRAAAAAGVGRLLYTSSAATLGERKGTVGSEASPHRGSFLSEYERSKFEAERVVLIEGRARDLDVVCVNPSSVQGPGRTGGTAKILVAFLNGKLKYFVKTNISLVDIDDCARGHLLAAQRGRDGQRYVLNGASIPIERALEIVAEITGTRHRPRILPGTLATAGGTVVGALARLRGGESAPVCREMVRTLRHGHDYDGSRAARELGLVYTPIEETLRRTVEWLVDEGLTPARPRLN